MASKYTDKLKAMLEGNVKKEEATNASSFSAPLNESASVKDRLAKIIKAADVRANESYIKQLSQNRATVERAQARAAEYENFIKNRTQEAIQADIDAAKKEDSNAKLFSGKWFKDIAEEGKSLVGGNIQQTAKTRNDASEKVQKLEEELAQRKAYDYGKLKENNDFEEKSKYVRNNDDFYGYINNDPIATERYISTETMEVPGLFREYFGMSDPQAETMTDDEIATYNYLYATAGREKANEYYEFLKSDLNARYREVKDVERKEFAKENPGLATVGSVAANIGSVITAPALLAQQEVYGKIDKNDPLYSTTQVKNTYRNTVSKDWGPVGSFAYNVGMSMVDFVTALGLQAATGGIISTQFILSSSSTIDTTLDALERGVSSDKALAMGLAAGAVEAITEKVSIDALLEDYSKKGIKQFILSNIASEASEEAVAEIANTITDVILAGDKSYWRQAVEELKAQGYSESQAVAKALVDKMGEVGLAALGGALSGGIMAGGKVAIGETDAAIQQAAKIAKGRNTAYRGQEILRQSQNSHSNAQQTEQKKGIVLPTEVEKARAEARERGDVFDVGYERQYTGYANTLADDELDAKVDAAETITEKTGIRYGASEEDISNALEIGRALGREIEFFNQKSADGKTVTDGFYSPENNRIYVNVNAIKKLETSISHELTHSYENTVSYALLENLAKEKLGKNFEREVNRLRKLYEEAHVDYATEEDPDGSKKFREDVVANFVERYVLGDKKSIEEIAKKKTTFARKVKMWLNNLLSKLYRDPNASETVIKAVREMNDMYSIVMSTAEEEAKAKTESKDVATESKTREVAMDEEISTEEETPVTEASESSHEGKREEPAKEKAPAKAEANEKTSERGTAATGETNTDYIEEAEEFLQDAKAAYEAGRFTDEQYAEAERMYEDWYETGVSPEITSYGFTERDFKKGMQEIKQARKDRKRGLKYSVSEVSPITAEDIRTAEQHFGTTKNFEVAGYLMTDGKMLDFSGKHWGDDYSTSRQVDHRDVLEAFDYSGEHNGNNGVKAMVDMIGSGQIRLMPESGGINIAVAPNDAQIKTLADYIRHFHGEVIVDVDEVGGDTIHTFTYNKGTAPMTVIRDIMQYFEDGTIPQEQPEYRQFLQWSVSPTLENDLDAVLNYTFDAQNNEVYIGETSNFLTKVIGVDSMPVYMPASKAYSAMVSKEEWERTRYYKEQDHYHDLGKEKMIEILNASENPIAAFVATTDIDGNERGNRIVLVTDVKVDGKNAVVIEEINATALKEGRRVKANKVITTYDRAAIVDDIVNAYYENRLLHYDKKRSQYLAGVQGSKPQAAIRDTDFTNNITQFWWNVNKEKINVTNLQYSVSGTETAKEENTEPIDTYKELPGKAQTYLRKVEDRIGRAFDKALELELAGEEGDYKTKEYKAFLKEAVRPITLEYLETGEISRETVSEIFEKYYKSPRSLPAYMYDQAKMDARGVFENIINENWNDLRNVRRYAEQAKIEKAKLTTMEPISREDARQRFATLKEMQKHERTAIRENLLTDEDMLEVGKLLRGQITLESLNPVKNNIAGIRAVFEAKRQTIEAERAVDEYKRRIKAQYYSYWDNKLDTMFEWKDKRNGLLYQRETLERNIQDIVNDKALAQEIIRDIISPIHAHEADSTRWKTKLAARVKKLDISLKKTGRNTVSESFAVQFYGEASDNIRRLEANPYKNATIDGKTLKDWQAALDNMWLQNPDLDQKKIKNAAEEFRKIYEKIFEEMNNVLLDNGYPPVSYRQGYFPHFTGEEETVLAKFGRLIGIKTEMMNLPTTINGLTENFKPGKTWFGHAQQRQGFHTTYDAVTGFEQYIIGAANVIFHTEDIQKLRAMSSRIRYNASDDGIRAEINKILNNETLDDEQKEKLLADLRSEGKFALSNFAAYLDEYTNKLANKKSRLDRGVESLLGRKFYVVMNNLESRVAANMIAGNFGSALTNFIPVNQAGAQLGWGWMLKGLNSAYKNVLNDDRITAASDFLVNRRGYDPITKKFLDKTSDFFGKPMTIIDNLASEWIVRAAYARYLSEGLTPNEALYQADLFAASVMADRSKGAVPLIFENKNPILKVFTQFQVEVNNEFSVLLKDIPRRERKRWTDAVAWVLFKYFLGAFLYNELYELIVGRRAALDPIGIVSEAIEDVREGEKVGVALKNAGTSTLEQLPFVGGVMGGGRVPIQSAVPDLGTIAGAINSDWDKKKKAQTIWKQAAKPLTYLVLPFGGGMFKKLIEGGATIIRGGKYVYDAEGRKMLQYPFYNDQGLASWGEGARTVLFGPTSTIAGQEWVDNGFGSLGAMQTAVYKSLIESGVDSKVAYNTIVDLAAVKSEQKETKTETYNFNGIEVEMEVPVDPEADVATKAELQREMLRDTDLDGEDKALLYFGLMASDSEQVLMTKMDDMNANMGVVTDVLMGFKDAGSTPEKIDLLINADLKDEEKRLIYEDRISESRSEDIAAFAEAGMDFDTFLAANKKYNELYNGEGNSSYKATELARWINKNGFNADEKAVIEEAFKYYSMIPSAAANYDKFTEAGLDDETSYKLTTALGDLEPKEGKKTVSDLQKYRAVIDTVGSPAEQMAALQQVMSESDFKKTTVAASYNIDAETYITFRETLLNFDKDGNNSLSQAEVESALNSLSGNLSWSEKMTIELAGGSMPGIIYLKDNQLAVLWQLANPTWAPKNNPYSAEIGAAVQKMFDTKK